MKKLLHERILIDNGDKTTLYQARRNAVNLVILWLCINKNLIIKTWKVSSELIPHLHKGINTVLER